MRDISVFSSPHNALARELVEDIGFLVVDNQFVLRVVHIVHLSFPVSFLENVISSSFPLYKYFSTPRTKNGQLQLLCPWICYQLIRKLNTLTCPKLFMEVIGHQDNFAHNHYDGNNEFVIVLLIVLLEAFYLNQDQDLCNTECFCIALI